MEEHQRSILLEAASRFPPPSGVKLSYGTAGFRADASILSSTVFRMGILAALRSIKTRSVVGLMITASHNQVSDNGVKIADPSGGMMTQEWEPFADAIANATDAEALVQLITQFVKHEGIILRGGESTEILLGRDTRPSGEALLGAAKQGINAIVGAISVDMGVLTTPQLHWMVRHRNKGLKASKSEYLAQLASSLGCASLDGDADRLVYFHLHNASKNSVVLVDGDKILSLFALFIKEQLNILGVKYLHEKAAEYDVGIYFEANGHGTILFSETFLKWLGHRNEELLSTSGLEQQKAALRLLAASELINQAVGDALSGLLLVEAILQHMGWSIENWSKLYQDLPSRQLKVKVADRTAVTTANAETVVAQPSGLQDAINAEVAKYSRGRSFVRPSGTEDVVRVYAEASSQETADHLAYSVAKHVEQFLQRP